MTRTYASITERISDIILKPMTGRLWLLGVVLATLLTVLFIYSNVVLFATGPGIWGINIPIAWGFAITNYVWWIGIGMAGTFISAALLLLRQKWRNSINRFAETMTVFAVAISGLFPIYHLGRPWFFYWLMPYPNIMVLWPQWRSALVWDFFAVMTYLIISVLFWYVGMIPDLATLRDRARGHFAQFIYGSLALGWRGEVRHWQRYETAIKLLAGLAVPTVFTVHSEVAMDFTTGNLPGWHSTIWPPYFVAGALYSGFAMVLVLAIPMRARFQLKDMVTDRHLDNMAKVLLATTQVMCYCYLTDTFFEFFKGNEFERYVAMNRAFGAYSPIFWTTMFLNAMLPQLLWFRKIRRNVVVLFIISLGVVIGMWFERFMIIVTALQRDFMPSAWGMFYPTMWDWFFLFGSVGLFWFLFFLFVRLFPSISIHEVRRLAYEEGKGT